MCTRKDDRYLGSGKLLKQAIKKYGRNNFERKILAEANDLDELLYLEEYYIGKFSAVESLNYYNLIDGGFGGNSEVLSQYWKSFTKEERKTARNWNGHFMHNKFNRYDEEWKQNVSDGVKKSWDKLSDKERKTRGQKSGKRIKELGSVAGKNNGMYGRSAVKEKNLKWYTNGKDNLYITEGTQPQGYERGRTMPRNKGKNSDNI